MSEPAIVAWGRGLVKNYPKQEFKNCLTRAFKDGRADFVTLDSNTRGQKFLAACIAWALDKKWLRNDREQSDDQSAISSFRLTAAGKKSLGIY